MARTRNQNKQPQQKTAPEKPKKNAKVKKLASSAETVPRGKPKSGRVWKTEKTKFSSIVKTRGVKSSFEKRQVVQEDLKRIREASRAIIAAKNEEKELKKQRRRDNLKKQEENRQKSEIVQVITNTSKIKKMKKKQLRYVQKRDTTSKV